MSGSDSRLEALLASQGELVGSLTHDLKGLLTGIEGGLYMVNSGVTKGKKERVDQGNEMLRRNLARMRRALAGVLYYVKDRELNWTSIDIQNVAESATKALEDETRLFGVKLRKEIDAGAFIGDQLAIHSILVNLLEYSIDVCRSEPTETDQRVDFSIKLKDDILVVRISINGYCMDLETKQRVLEEFYSPRGGDRTHLPLYITHKLIKWHEGTFNIEATEETKKTQFTLEIPKTRPMQK